MVGSSKEPNAMPCHLKRPGGTCSVEDRTNPRWPLRFDLEPQYSSASFDRMMFEPPAIEIITVLGLEKPKQWWTNPLKTSNPILPGYHRIPPSSPILPAVANPASTWAPPIGCPLRRPAATWHSPRWNPPEDGRNPSGTDVETALDRCGYPASNMIQIGETTSLVSQKKTQALS